MLQTFLPMFFMTFGISLFVLLMQLLWRYIDDFVGKGIDMIILAKFFFYATLSIVPMALPLAVLLASLMTFGNLGERFELLAMKASGISLLRIMKPLITLSVLISILSFIFLNNVIPVAQVKMWALMYAIREKSPEVEIPEGVFYKGIPGVNVYVEKKDLKTGLFLDMMLYDYSDGFNNARIILADSGRLKISSDKLYYILSLYSGESFENLQSQTQSSVRTNTQAVPYRRENFKTKDILIEYDQNFELKDESFLQNQYIGKNLASLQHSIDSMTVLVDSVRNLNTLDLYNASYKRSIERAGGYHAIRPVHQIPADGLAASPDNKGQSPEDEEEKEAFLSYDEVWESKSLSERTSLLTRAKESIRSTTNDYQFRAGPLNQDMRVIIRHYTEMHKKFTSSIACLFFFFIGAPLGAIIRKGGLGTPVVLSVLIFIFYYVIDTLGFKMARDAIWEPWEGMWLSAFVLFPLGMWLTYKAVKDSTLLDADTYLNSIKKALGIRSSRNVEKKEVIIYTPDYTQALARIDNLDLLCEQYTQTHKRWPSYFAFWRAGGKDNSALKVSEELESLIEELSNSDRILLLNKLMDYPIMTSYNILGDQVSKRVGIVLAIFIPVGLPVYFIAMYRLKLIRHDIQMIRKVNNELKDIIQEEK